jgi:hypothetical protein
MTTMKTMKNIQYAGRMQRLCNSRQQPVSLHAVVDSRELLDVGSGRTMDNKPFRLIDCLLPTNAPDANFI